MKEEKKKPVLGKFGNFFTTGRRKPPKNTLEDSLRPGIKREESTSSSHEDLAPLASLDIEEDLSKSEESLVDQAYNPDQSRTPNTIEDQQEYLYNKDLTHLYNDIVSEWNTKRVSSDSEWSPDWHSSNETIKNTLFDSNLTLQTLETESDLCNDTSNITTPDFFKSLTNVSSEDLDILNHKQLVDVHTVAESDYVASKDQPSNLESKPPDPIYPSRVLTVDIFLRRAEQRNSEVRVNDILDENHISIDTMDKKSAVRRSGKRRKSQSSSDVPNGDRNTTENAAKEEPVLDGVLSDAGVEKANISERKAKASQQINSPTSNHEIRAGAVSNHKGLTKTELEKNKQQATSSSSPYRRKSLRKDLTNAGPLSPTSPKSHGKESSTKRQNEGATDGNSVSKYTSVDKSSSSERTVETSKVFPTDLVGSNSTLPPSEGRTDAKVSHFAHTLDGSDLSYTGKHKNGEMRTVSEKQRSSGLDSDKDRSVCFDDSRTVTTKFSL